MLFVYISLLYIIICFIILKVFIYYFLVVKYGYYMCIFNTYDKWQHGFYQNQVGLCVNIYTIYHK